MNAQFHISTEELMIGPVSEFTYSWCINYRLPEEDAVRFSIAVSELITNITLFAYPYSSQNTFELTYNSNLTNLEIVVSEVGEPFDPDRHRYNAKKAIHEDNFEGAGFRLIRRFCDEFLFINKGKEGKEFRLIKQLSVREIDVILERPKSKQQQINLGSAKSSQPRITAREYSISQVKPADAEDIAKLIYRTYEYRYGKDDMYFPKRIEETMRSKRKLGVITRNVENRAVGYFAVLKKDDSNIAEVGEAVVSPDYRRRGIMSNMMQRLIHIARKHKLAALFGKAVTNHPVSQKVNHKYGFITTGLMLAESHNVFFRGFDENYPQPVSVAIDFLPLQPREKRDVHLPEKYADIILETYQKLSVPVEPAQTSSSKMAKKSDMQLIINYSDYTSLIIVNKYGPDFRDVLSKMIDSLQEQEDLNAIYLDLPLENTATPEQFETISDMGFIYCGLIPMFHQEADFVRLQKVCTDLDFNLIEIFSDFGQNLKTRISNELN